MKCIRLRLRLLRCQLRLRHEILTPAEGAQFGPLLTLEVRSQIIKVVRHILTHCDMQGRQSKINISYTRFTREIHWP